MQSSYLGQEVNPSLKYTAFNFSALDPKVKKNIFSYIRDKKDLASVSLTSKEWHAYVKFPLGCLKTYEKYRPFVSRPATPLATRDTNIQSSQEMPASPVFMPRSNPSQIFVALKFKNLNTGDYVKPNAAVPNNTPLSVEVSNLNQELSIRVVTRVENSTNEPVYEFGQRVVDLGPLRKIVMQSFIAQHIDSPLQIKVLTCPLPLSHENFYDYLTVHLLAAPIRPTPMNLDSMDS